MVYIFNSALCKYHVRVICMELFISNEKKKIERENVVGSSSNHKSQLNIELEVSMWLLMIQSSQQWHSYYQSLQFTSDLGKSEEIFQKPQTLFVFTWLFTISIQFDCSIFISTSERYTSHKHRRTANKMDSEQYFGHLLSH